MWEIIFFYWSCCLCNRLQKKNLYFISHLFFSSWNCLYVMRKDDDNWKITKRSKRCYVYEYTSLAFVFCLRSALLLLSLSLSSLFFEKLRAYKRIICVIDARASFLLLLLLLLYSLPDMFYNHTNITFRCMCASKEDEQRERERKDAKKLSIECV